ncbi:MAG: hypothetical protein ABI216_22205 [Devosia sp.]
MKIPEGWPTEKMIKVGIGSFWNSYSSCAHLSVSVEKALKAMLEAAPTPPAQEDGELRKAAQVVVDYHPAGTSLNRYHELVNNLRVALEKKS